MRSKPLDEQVVVVTGASSRIGLATALIAASRGARAALGVFGARFAPPRDPTGALHRPDEASVAGAGPMRGRGSEAAAGPRARRGAVAAGRARAHASERLKPEPGPGDGSTLDWMAWAAAEDSPRAGTAARAAAGRAAIPPASPDALVPGAHGAAGASDR